MIGDVQVLDQVLGDGFAAYHGDCVEVVRGLPDNSVDFIIYSPPFSSLYCYSNSPRDLGNSKDYMEFARHYRFLLKELYRVLKPGRLMSVHCMTLPTSKQHDGFIGLRDFPGHIIKWHQRTGMIFHSKVTIFKDPVTAMQRTKAIGLLYKQLKKDSALSRQGIPDELLTFRKPGANPDPITKDPDDFPVSLWQNYASPVWDDINPSDTLQYTTAREHDDERHIAPLQLEVIRRAIRLWTNPGDVVLSPFGGIGSEGHVSLELGRRFIGAELKTSYYRVMVRNLDEAAAKARTPDLFSLAGVSL